MRNIWLLFFLLTTTLALAGCGLFEDDPPEVTAFTKSYFYYPEGRVWVYEDTLNGSLDTIFCEASASGEFDFDDDYVSYGTVAESSVRLNITDNQLQSMGLTTLAIHDNSVDIVLLLYDYKDINDRTSLLARVLRNESMVTNDDKHWTYSDLTFEYDGILDECHLNEMVFTNVMEFTYRYEERIGSDYFIGLKVAQNVGIIEYTRYDSLHFQLIETYDQ